ncbi:MAG TPA: hypothetical protein PKV91_01325 [Bacillota bacterium]|mgnify:FL=1|nr:hypothetical protein [Bacillota bacterium]HOA35004.1 hypothetical protein [Bacillota bacterium]HOL15006.1 hypothetical protein [Bacillota bacterium]HPZ10977.1 hypothetical protein [Bacillota bacterium]HQE09143.1 hypothetical protein [Bacillota bacterium]
MERQLHISREFAELQERLRALRTEMVKLIADRDHLLRTVKPNLEAKYYATIGKEQQRLSLLRNDVLRLRRKIELMRASLNRGEKPDLELIEERLDEELQQWVEELRELARRVEWAVDYNRLPRLSAEESRELRRLYRELVRKLHPDLNETLPDNFKYLWDRVLTAYRNGDLEELQTLSLLLSEHKEELPPEPSTMEQLVADIKKLEQKIRKLLEEISKMQEQFPFSYQEKLADPAWIAAQKENIEKQIAEMERHRQTYQSILAELGGGEASTVH